MTDAAAGHPDGELRLIGRIPTASNAAFLASVGETPVIYKPTAGEKPLWDFPDGDLAQREVAAYLVSEALGWGIVPPTWLRDGPFGAGMVQLWREPSGPRAVELSPPEARADDGRRRVFDIIGEPDFPVAILHEDSAALRHIAVFDVIVNNADRKGGHILEMPGGHRHGVDHGLTFHVDDKLRTVLWGWVGDELTDAELAGVAAVRAALASALGVALAELLNPYELEMLDFRCELLLTEHRFPAPQGSWHTVPWPLM
ncbi:SCO1664 family protein [Gryllotalpicola protaetiae]|uniref:SCO1664 family protein n=1 Tax=Gryllotalpicola protaetiae TaxID=2419771 RepID=A0A387BUE8_9MICO|nr:SCO1664 family protein [Gryllotalpicola protaetiae]AYG04676.1 SCO1664 family protein [Gryllotalpicola protaetiae]